MPEVFQWLQKNGNVEQTEMYRTFNCGVGMVIAVPAAQADDCIQLLKDLNEDAWQIGEIVKAEQDTEQVIFN